MSTIIEMTNPVKTCTKCDTVRHTSEFGRRAKKEHDLLPVCSPCMRSLGKRNLAALKKQRTWSMKFRALIKNIIGGK